MHLESTLATRRDSGFTLVELSIVIVIIGLIIGGVLVGNTMLEAAGLRKTLKEFEDYETSIATFKLKYGQLPGDLDKAVRFFGTTNSMGNAIHDGDGDGIIEDEARFGISYYETFAAWDHLSQAGLITGQYAGIPWSPGDDLVPGWNVPRAYYAPPSNASAHEGAGCGIYHDSSRRHFIQIGWDASGWAEGETVRPDHAYTMDLKIDDGKANSGKMVAYDGAFDYAGCLDGGNEYDVTVTTGECTLMYYINF